MFSRYFLFSTFILLGLMYLATSIPPIAHAAPSDDFVIMVDTTKPGTTTNTQFLISTFGTGYDYNVDCNSDGTNEATAQTGDYTCQYATPGTHTIRIKDNSGVGTGFPRIDFLGTLPGDFRDAQKLLFITHWGTGKWTTMNHAFAGAINMNIVATDSPDLSNVSDLGYMFFEDESFNAAINYWNTSHVTNMSHMFHNASAFNQPLGTWNTAKVTTMAHMFEGATKFNQNLRKWNVTALVDATSMFHGDKLAVSNYDAVLNSWHLQEVLSNVAFDGGKSQFCKSAAARHDLISTDDWSITDGGKNCTAADLQIEKTVRKVGSRHEYRIEVKNTSAKPAKGVTVIDTMPGNYSDITYGGAADCSSPDGGFTIFCEENRLPPGSTLIIHIDATPHGTTGKNCATVQTITLDPDRENNRACVAVPK